MEPAIIAFFMALLLSLTLTPLVKHLAVRIGAVDEPKDFRRIHVKPIPRLGGLAIYTSFWIAILLVTQKVMLSDGNSFPSRIHFPGLFAGSIIILFLGIFDDIKGAKPYVKIIFQTLAGVIAYFSGFKIAALQTPMGVWEFGLLSLPITVFWVLTITNAINLIDGMDGLATGVGFVASITIFILSILAHNWSGTLLTAGLAGSALGFLMFNFSPATIFLGDSGSLTIGYLLSCISLSVGSYRHTAMGLAIPMIIFALPIADTLLAILRRWSRRLPISIADREHIHHKLLSLGLSQAQAVTILYAFTIALGTIAIALSLCNTKTQLLISILLIVFLFYIVKRLRWHDIDMVSQRIQSDLQQKKNAKKIWTLLNQTCSEIRCARSEYQLKELLVETFDQLNLTRVVLNTNLPSLMEPGENFCLFYHQDTSAAKHMSNSWSCHLTIDNGGKFIGNLFVFQDIDSRGFSSDLVHSLKNICQALSDRLVPNQAIIPENTTSSEKHQESRIPAVLLVHPDTTYIETFRNYFRDKNIHMVVTKRKKDLISYLNALHCLAIFIDMDTIPPTENNLFDKIFQNNPTIPVIIIHEAQITDSEKNDLYRKGVIAFLSKPLNSKKLAHVLNCIA